MIILVKDWNRSASKLLLFNKNITILGFHWNDNYNKMLESFTCFGPKFYQNQMKNKKVLLIARLTDDNGSVKEVGEFGPYHMYMSYHFDES